MRIGLVLSGGGVKGAAYIGVLKALKEYNIEITAISGTSSGSIIAALFSCGYTPNEMYYIFKKYCNVITDYDHMIPFKVIGTLFTGKIKLKYLAKGNNLEKLMYYFARRKNISYLKDIKIPLAISSVNVKNGQITYFTNFWPKRNTTIYEDNEKIVMDTTLWECVRASTAFPGVFEAKKINNTYYIDGGTRVNTPVSILKSVCKDKIMAIHFEKENNNTIPQNIVGSVCKAWDIMSHEINKEEIEKADYKVDIECADVSLLDMKKLDYMVNIGYMTMKKYINEYMLND